jgi:hypothetical protein
MASRSQSAVEFITTYGWAIIAVIVALGVLYSLGIFGLGSSGGSGCDVVAGFSCSKPILSSAGILTMGLGQIGGIKTITATGCSKNSTAPTVWEGTGVALQSGQVANMSFYCPSVSGSQLGSTFTGTLWIKYSSGSGGGGPTVTQEVGAIKIPVSTAGISCTSTSCDSLITSTNSNTVSGTGSNFQQMIVINPSLYIAYEASDLGNIRFYSSNAPANPSNELYSWCESGCSRNGSTSAVFWVKLPNGIAASSSAAINMIFLPTSTDYDGFYAGEAPQLTVTSPPFISSTHISYTANSAISQDANGLVIPIVSDGSAPLYICAGALNPAVGGGIQNYEMNYNYNIANGGTDEGVYATAVGTQTQDLCQSWSNQWSGYNYQNAEVGSAISINGYTTYTLYTSPSYGQATTTNQYSSGSFTVSTYNAFVVVAVACGYAACDHTAQAVAAGSTGNVIIENSGSTNLIGTACTLQTSVDSDGQDNTSIYTCNLAPGSYTAAANNNGATGGAAMTLAVYVFQNTSISTNYGKYDNGANVFATYQSFAGSSTPSGWSLSNGYPCNPSTIKFNNGVNVTGTGCRGEFINGPSAGGTMDADTDWISTKGSGGSGENFVAFTASGALVGGFTTTSANVVQAYANTAGGAYPTPVAIYQPLNQWAVESSSLIGSGAFAVFDFQLNYGPVSYSGVGPATGGSSFTQTLDNYGGWDTLNMQWMRTRVTPPGDVMPTVAVGTFR